MFLNAGFWPLFWAVIGGGVALTGLLSWLVATIAQPHRGQPHRAPAPAPVEASPLRTREPAQPRRAA